MSQLERTHIHFDSGINGRFLRVQLQGGKTSLTSDHLGKRIVAENRENQSMCLVSLTEEYFAFLGTHMGSLQPNCHPSNAAKPHETHTVRYSLALEDLRKVITMAGYNTFLEIQKLPISFICLYSDTGLMERNIQSIQANAGLLPELPL